VTEAADGMGGSYPSMAALAANYSDAFLGWYSPDTPRPIQAKGDPRRKIGIIGIGQ
jgi:hypothetical protein